MAFETITVIGLGYIGLPTATLLAHEGFQVCGVDLDAQKVAQINAGVAPINEPQLSALLEQAVTEGQLSATDQPRSADVIIIAVPTPRVAAHTPDLSYVHQAVQSIAPVLKPGNLVILESTSPVGTTEKLAYWLSTWRGDLTFEGDQPDIAIAYCPERVLPGKILYELQHNDRIIGGITSACSEKARQFYQRFVYGECRTTQARTAEIAKLTENAFRDINIAFANELSMICDKLDIDVWELIDLVNHHPRVNLLKPGPGVGGHCIAVDPWFIVNSAPDESRLVRMAREVNDSKPSFVVKQVVRQTKSMAEPVIACLGLTFKANVDDVRESPALEITRQLAELYAPLYVVEPHLKALPEVLKSFDAVYLSSVDQALEQANLVVLLVDHDVFSCIRKEDLNNKSVIDTRGFFRRVNVSSKSSRSSIEHG